MQEKNWSEIKRKIFTAVMVAVLLVCSFSLNSLESNAAVIDEYYLDYAEPTCSDTQGYISLAVRNYSTGVIEIHTFFWNVYALDGTEEKPCQMYCDMDSGTIRFRPYVNTNFVDSALILLTHVNENGVFIPYAPRDNTTGAPSWNWSANYYTLLGFKYGGNALGDWEIPQSYNFALYFATDGSAQQLMYIYGLIQSSNSINQTQLNTLLSMLNQQSTTNQKLDDVKTYLQSIRGDLDDISKQLDEILGEEKKQTSWLQKIWEALTGSDSQKEEIEEEKSKAEQQAGQLGQLNEQNKTDKVDPGQANDSVNSAIDKNQIQNYSIVLSVFTNESHISQMLLIVIAIALVGYVFFGKR